MSPRQVTKRPTRTDLEFPRSRRRASRQVVTEQRGRNGVHAGLQPGLGLTRPDRDLRGPADPDPVRAARRPQAEGPVGGADLARCGNGGRDDRLRHARGPDRAVGARGRGVRALPDHVDRRDGDLGLQHDRRDRALRRAAAIVRRDLGGPAHPGRDHRLLLRRADGGARRLRHPGRDHRGDDDRPRLQADQGGRRSPSSPTPRRSPSARSRSRSPRCRRSPASTRATSARWSVARRRSSR